MLDRRIRLFGAGALLGIAGIYLDARWLVWIAIAVLVAGFFLRFVGKGRPEEEEDDEEDEEEGRDPEGRRGP